MSTPAPPATLSASPKEVGETGAEKGASGGLGKGTALMTGKKVLFSARFMWLK